MCPKLEGLSINNCNNYIVVYILAINAFRATIPPIKHSLNTV